MQALASIAAAFTGTATPVQGGSATAAGAASVSFTFASTVTAGSTLIAFVGISGSTPSGSSSISDTAGNTWVLITDSTETDATCEVAMWYVIGCLGGANTITVTNNAGLSYDLQAWEYPSTLTALDTWGGGDNSYTWDMDCQTIYADTGGEAMIASVDDTVIVGTYNPQGSQFAMVMGSTSKPPLPRDIWKLRNQSHNASGSTSALFDAAIPEDTAFGVNVSLPAPICPSGGFSGQQPVRIAQDYLHLSNGWRTVNRRYPTNCGPFEYYDPATNIWNLYAVLMTATSGAVDVFKSVDEGITWAKVGTTPINSALDWWSPAIQYGNKIHVLWTEIHQTTHRESAGLFVSTFDMSSDSWTATTTTAPGTVSTNPQALAYDFVVPAADTFVLIYNNEFHGTPTTTDVMINRYSSGAWAVATVFAAGSILCGLSFDQATLTAYVVFEDWSPIFTPPLPPRTLKLSTVTNFSWPFTPPTPVTIQSGILQTTGTRRLPGAGPAVVYRGKLYIPYVRVEVSGSSPTWNIPACYVSTSPTTFTSVDLTPYAPQGYTVTDQENNTETDIWATVIGTRLYFFWKQGRGAPERIRMAISADGSLPAPVSTFFDLNLNLPDYLQNDMDPEATVTSYLSCLSINQLFGARIGIVANFESPNGGTEIPPEAYFLPLVPGGTPVPGKLGNRFY